MSKPERYNVPSYPGHLAPDELEVIYEKACRDLADDSLGRLDPASLKQPVPFEFLFRALAPMMVQMHWQRDRIAMLESLLAATGNVWSQAIATTPDAAALLGDAASLDTDALLDAAGLLAEAARQPDVVLPDAAAHLDTVALLDTVVPEGEAAPIKAAVETDAAVPMNGVAVSNAATPLNDLMSPDNAALPDEAVHLNTIALLDTAVPLNGVALKNEAGQPDAAVPMKAVAEPNGTTLKNSAGLMEAVVRMNATAPMKATTLPNAAAAMKAARLPNAAVAMKDTTRANGAETSDAVMLLEGVSPSKTTKAPMVIRLREPAPPPPLAATREPLTIVKTPRGRSEQKMEPVLHPQVQQNNEIEHNRNSENSGHAPAPELPEVSNPPTVAKAQTSLKAPTIKAPTLNVHVKSRKM